MDMSHAGLTGVADQNPGHDRTVTDSHPAESGTSGATRSTASNERGLGLLLAVTCPCWAARRVQFFSKVLDHLNVRVSHDWLPSQP